MGEVEAPAQQNVEVAYLTEYFLAAAQLLDLALIAEAQEEEGADFE